MGLHIVHTGGIWVCVWYTQEAGSSYGTHRRYMVGERGAPSLPVLLSPGGRCAPLWRSRDTPPRQRPTSVAHPARSAASGTADH